MNIKTLKLKALVRYWEDSTFNGVSDNEEGDLAPCKDGDLWSPIIDVETGIILNWKIGTVAKIHYKVADGCGYDLTDDMGNIVITREDGYVCITLNPVENDPGDYIVMNIDENGKIDNWNFNVRHFNNG